MLRVTNVVLPCHLIHLSVSNIQMWLFRVIYRNVVVVLWSLAKLASRIIR